MPRVRVRVRRARLVRAIKIRTKVLMYARRSSRGIIREIPARARALHFVFPPPLPCLVIPFAHARSEPFVREAGKQRRPVYRLARSRAPARARVAKARLIVSRVLVIRQRKRASRRDDRLIWNTTTPSHRSPPPPVPAIAITYARITDIVARKLSRFKVTRLREFDAARRCLLRAAHRRRRRR